MLLTLLLRRICTHFWLFSDLTMFLSNILQCPHLLSVQTNWKSFYFNKSIPSNYQSLNIMNADSTNAVLYYQYFPQGFALVWWSFLPWSVYTLHSARANSHPPSIRFRDKKHRILLSADLKGRTRQETPVASDIHPAVLWDESLFYFRAFLSGVF